MPQVRAWVPGVPHVRASVPGVPHVRACTTSGQPDDTPARGIRHRRVPPQPRNRARRHRSRTTPAPASSPATAVPIVERPGRAQPRANRRTRRPAASDRGMSLRSPAVVSAVARRAQPRPRPHPATAVPTVEQPGRAPRRGTGRAQIRADGTTRQPAASDTGVSLRSPGVMPADAGRVQPRPRSQPDDRRSYRRAAWAGTASGTGRAQPRADGTTRQPAASDTGMSLHGPAIVPAVADRLQLRAVVLTGAASSPADGCVGSSRTRRAIAGCRGPGVHDGRRVRRRR